MKRHAANIITCCRIVSGIAMLFFPVFTYGFYITYLLCGISDMTDGFVARKTNSVSEFGSRLDTIADFVFFSAALVKILPEITVPSWITIWICTIAVIKIANVLLGFVYHKRFFAEHTDLNKTTGLLLFILPLTLSFVEFTYPAAIICACATCAAIQEWYYVSKGIEI